MKRYDASSIMMSLDGIPLIPDDSGEFVEFDEAQAEIKAAVEAERERCAKLVDDWFSIVGSSHFHAYMVVDGVVKLTAATELAKSMREEPKAHYNRGITCLDPENDDDNGGYL